MTQSQSQGLDPTIFPTEPPSLYISHYFCQQCGGLTYLPDQLILTPHKLRWCICHWSELQQTFAKAADYYAGQDEGDDEEKKPDAQDWWVLGKNERKTA